MMVVHTWPDTWLGSIQGPWASREKYSRWYSCLGYRESTGLRKYDWTLHGSGAVIPGRYRTGWAPVHTSKATAVREHNNNTHGRSRNYRSRRCAIDAQVLGSAALLRTSCCTCHAYRPSYCITYSWLTKSDMLDLWFELSKCDNQVRDHLQLFNDRLVLLLKSNMFDL